MLTFGHSLFFVQKKSFKVEKFAGTASKAMSRGSGGKHMETVKVKRNVFVFIIVHVLVNVYSIPRLFSSLANLY